MLASKPNPSGASEASNHKQPSDRRATLSAPRVSRLAKPASKPADRAPASPLRNHALDRSSASIDLQTPSPTTKPSPPGRAAERRSFKASPSPSSRGSTATVPRAAARTSELQVQLALVQEDLRNAREHLAAIENDRAQILDDLAVARRLAADAHGRLEESLVSRRAAEEALELERFKSTEREQSAVEAEEEWRRKHDGVARRHADDVASLLATARELDAVRDELAATARAKDSALNRADELHAAIDGLRSELQLLHEAHRQTVSDEKTASTQAGHLAEDKNRLLRELADTREEREKAKKAVEDLAAALREASSEAREGKESVLAKQAEVDDARLQMSELKAAMKNAEERYRLRIEESNNENACLRKTVERMGSEAKIVLKDDNDMLKRSDDVISSIHLEMNRLTESLRAAENEVQELRADKTQLLSKLQEFEVQATNTEEEAKAESSQLKDLLSSKDTELLALNHELIKALQTKLEMDNVLESLKAAEGEAKAAKEEKVQLQSKLKLLQSKITEANLTSEEAKISSLRLKETLEGKEQELASIVQENREMRAREAAAHAKIDELAVLLSEATMARKGGELSNDTAAVTRSPEKQPSVLLKLICSPMHHHNVRDDDNNGEIIQNLKEDIKHVEMETVRQVKHEKESGVSPSAVDSASSLENSKVMEEDDQLSKDRDGDSESSEDDDIESPGDDALVDQMNGLLIHGPTSSFNSDQRVQKKKRALLKKFGSLLKKKAHFTKLSSHSHSS